MEPEEFNDLCDECEGLGLVPDYMSGDEVECPECEGTGLNEENR